MRVTPLRWLFAMLSLAQPAAGETLRWDQAVDRALQPGETVEFALTAPDTAGGLQLHARESGVDLELRWQSGERTLSSNDGDFPRTGEHRLAANLEPRQTGIVQIRATRPGSRGGRFRLQARWIELTGAAEARRHAADLLETDVAQRIADAARSGEAASVDAAQQLRTLRQELGDSRDTARALFLHDQLLRRQNRRPELIAVLEAALPWLREVGDAQFIAAAYNNIGMSHWRLGDGRRAEAPLRQALAALAGDKDSLFATLIEGNLCLVVASRQSVDANVACSLRNRERSEATGDYARIAVAWNNLAGAYSLAGQSAQAADGYRQAIESGERAGGRNIADPLMNLGLERFAQGRYEEARELYARAEAIYRRDDNPRNLALLLRHRGSLAILLGDTQQGGQLLQEALAIQRRVRNSEDIVRTLLRVGELERREASIPQIPPAFTEAVALAQVDADPRTLASALLALIASQIDTGQTDAARESLAKARPLADSLHDDYLRGRVEMQWARLSLATGDYAAALIQIRRALTLAQTGAPLVDAAEMHAVEGRALMAAQRLPDAALAYARGIALVERARASIHDAERRARFIATRRELYEGQAVSLAEHALSRNEPALIRDALAVVAEQRSRSLLEAIENRVTETAPRSDAYRRLAAREVELASARWLAQERGVPATAVASIDAELREVSAQLATLDRSRIDGAVAPTAQTREMSVVVATLAQQTTIVHYLVAAEHSYAWVADKDRTTLVRLAGRAELDAKITAARRIFDGDGATAEALSELCDLVWQPLRDALGSDTVLLVPDGRLHTVPWAALRCTNPNPGKPRLDLVETAEIRLMPSLRSADQIQRRRTTRRQRVANTARPVLVVVDPVYAADDARITASGRNTAQGTTTATLPRLPSSAREATTLQQRVQQSSLALLAGVQATRDAFLQLPLAHYRLIHLGMHGLVGRTLADSGIAFSLFDANGNALSGFLSARSVARLQLDADLVVLAACETAAGESLAGEGLLGTHYAFLAAGADQVVAATAPISDAVTSRLMEAFYRELDHTGHHPARALRSAQLEVRRDSRTRHPQYWAGFVTYGHDGSTAK